MNTLLLLLNLWTAHPAQACQPPPLNYDFLRTVSEILKSTEVQTAMRSHRMTGIDHLGNDGWVVRAGACALNLRVEHEFHPGGPCGGTVTYLVKTLGPVTCLP